MQANKFHRDFTKTNIKVGYAIMVNELLVLPASHPLRALFKLAWESFERNEWSTDGATFVNERYGFTMFEVAAFIHDWRNSCGYVGKHIDREFICIMILLNYKPETIFQRRRWMRMTPLNVLRHHFLGDLKKDCPTNLISI